MEVSGFGVLEVSKNKKNKPERQLNTEEYKLSDELLHPNVQGYSYHWNNVFYETP